MKILVKFPSRGRVVRFIESLDSIYSNIKNPDDVFVLATFDENDDSMNNDYIRKKLEEYPRFKGIYGDSKSKVDAINRDMNLINILWPEAKDWDVIVNMADDFKFTMYGWDEIIRLEFEKHGLDTLLHLPDQDAKSALATMYIAGRVFYDRFGYIYNPDYFSLFCDNHVQELAKMLRCYRYAHINGVIWHGNPAYGHLPRDSKFNSDQEIGWTTDQQTYIEYKAKNFEIEKWQK